MLADIIIPYAPYHADVVHRAIQSVQSQTVPCNVIPVRDTAGRGAGWARNKGASQSDSPFIVFADADDVMHPEFIERTLRTYQQGTYVYTDWQTPDGYIAKLPDNVAESGWYESQIFHLVTTLLPRAAFEHVGGFDETLPALEDLHLYMRLQAKGICGIRCPRTLMTYHVNEGQRSRQIVQSGQYEQLKRTIQMSTGVISMGCCGNGPAVDLTPQGERKDGDILVMTLYEGNRDVRGVVTGRRYSGGWGREVWIDPRDIDSTDYVTRKKAFERVIAAKDLTPDVETVLSLLDTQSGV